MKQLLLSLLILAPSSHYAQNHSVDVNATENSQLSTKTATDITVYTPNVRTYTVNDVSFKMIEVKGGTFLMGETSRQKMPRTDETPVHSVTLRSYYIGQTEVNQALWQAVMGNNPSNFVGSNKPVENISWDDCRKFISMLNALTGKRFRLPTEAEWEFASRGGNKSRGYIYSGGNSLDDVAWYADNSDDDTHDVGTRKPNELGLYDMSGNVLEWCSDWYGDYREKAQKNPKGPKKGLYRVVRGGSWLTKAENCCSSFRNSLSAYEGNANLGLRLALYE